MPSAATFQEESQMSLAAAPTVVPDAHVPTGRGLLGRDQLRQIVLSAVGPVVVYNLARAQKASEVASLLLAAVLPAAVAAAGMLRRRRLDLFAGLVLAGLVVSLLFAVLGGSPTLILMRDSFVTAALSLACAGSLIARRPLMYASGGSSPPPAARTGWRDSWRPPTIRLPCGASAS